MKKRLSICASLITISCFLVAQKVDPNFHIYLLAGQSNMAGRGPVDSLSKLTDPQIVMLDKNNNWVPATEPVHFDKPDVAGVGPAMSFAKEMIKGNNTIKIGLVPCAVGGSPISVWEPDSTFVAVYPYSVHPYDDAAKRTKMAMQSGVLKGILWHQGESDDNSQAAKVYLNKLKTLIVRLRALCHDPMLPFIAGETGYFFHDNNNVINQVLNQLPFTINNTATVSAEGLTDKGDKTHFDTPSARKLGIRYAIAMKQLQASARLIR